MKEYGGSECIDPHFIDVGTSWRWLVSFTPLPIYPRIKSTRYPLDRGLGGPQYRSGRRGENNNSWHYRDSNSDPSVVQPVASRYTDYAIPAPNCNVEGTLNKDAVNLDAVVDKLAAVCCIWAQACRVWFLLGKVVQRILFRSWQCTRRVTSSATHRTSFRARGVLPSLSLYAVILRCLGTRESLPHFYIT
jgi:hypothetical protein